MVLPFMWQGSDGLARPFRQPCQVRSEVRRRVLPLWHGWGFLYSAASTSVDAIIQAPVSAAGRDGQDPSGRDSSLRRSVRAMAEGPLRMVLPSMWQGSDGLARPFRQPCQVRSAVRRRLSLLWHGRGFLYSAASTSASGGWSGGVATRSCYWRRFSFTATGSPRLRSLLSGLLIFVH